jgi:hypothetical protein
MQSAPGSFILAVLLAQGPGETFQIPDETEVVLRLSEPLGSKRSFMGDVVRFTLAADLVVDGTLVARKGNRAVGTVTERNRSGLVGQAGTLTLRLDYLMVGDTKVQLRGSRFRAGESKAGTALGLALITPLGLLKRGKDVEIPEGSLFRGFVHGSTRVPRHALPNREETR